MRILDFFFLKIAVSEQLTSFIFELLNIEPLNPQNAKAPPKQGFETNYGGCETVF